MADYDMEAAVRTFFSCPRFAVAGASSDPRKFGHKIFAWYLLHSLPATPLNPRTATIEALSSTYPATSTPSALSIPSEYALSIITPPKVTLPLLKEAKEVGIEAVWLQPGTFDDEVMEYARREFKAAIGGMEGKKKLTGSEGEGWCVLVDGEWGMGLAGRKDDGEKL
ncbi:NAD(P)-binding protein [Viridothelium virens]|uniref:NAD(P)-binding protein n=1 Tax=Viridothelium virens TaxID=1048519 RepID=A0A6A6GYD4_VIRVR|nr:NAD(P)-binding protein [Viridothelium virens]